MSKQRAYLLFDTNVYLHYKAYSNTDKHWLEVSQGIKDVSLLVPSVVVRELDKHKDGNKVRALRDRARVALKRIEERLESKVLDGVECIFLSEPIHVDFAGHDLDTSVADDRLVASCIDYQAKNPDHLLIFVTGDSGPRIKARKYSWNTVEAPEALRLASALDDEERARRQLERELQRYQNRLPRLSLEFEEGGPLMKVILPPAPAPLDLEARMSEVEQRTPPLVYDESDEDDLNSLPAVLRAQSGIPTRAEYQRYARERASYLRDYRKYLHLLQEFKVKESLMFSLRLSIHNRGTAPASDIDVHLHFPDGFTLWRDDDEDDEERPWEPEEPDPPAPPGSVLSGFRGLGRMLGQMPQPLIPYLGPRNVSSPDIQRTQSYDVRLHVQFLKQRRSADIDELWIMFDSREAAKGFRVEYSLNCVDLLDEVTGELNIAVENS